MHGINDHFHLSRGRKEDVSASRFHSPWGRKEDVSASCSPSVPISSTSKAEKNSKNFLPIASSPVPPNPLGWVLRSVIAWARRLIEGPMVEDGAAMEDMNMDCQGSDDFQVEAELAILVLPSHTVSYKNLNLRGDDIHLDRRLLLLCAEMDTEQRLENLVSHQLD